MAHRGPYQTFTETCQACGRNIWDTDACVGEKPKRKKKKQTETWSDWPDF